MAAARIVALADEPAPPETADVVRRQRQLLRRAAALCLDPIAEERPGRHHLYLLVAALPSFRARHRQVP